ncbi:MAG: hypothetical protein AB7N65_16885 [Vicinamibacterales bacterium]
MGKRTHKRSELGEDHVARVLATAPSKAAAARTLGVDVSTVFRWTRRKDSRPGARAPRHQLQEASCSHLQGRATSNLWTATGSEAVSDDVYQVHCSTWRPEAATEDAAKNTSGAAGIPPADDPVAWAADIRTRYELTGAERLLLAQAVDAALMSKDTTIPPSARLQAMGRFAAHLKRLNLEPEANGETETTSRSTVRSWPRAVGRDA